jgi:hypothetical protein
VCDGVSESDGVMVKMKLFVCLFGLVVLEKLGKNRLYEGIPSRATTRRNTQHATQGTAAKSTTARQYLPFPYLTLPYLTLPRSDKPYILCRLPYLGQ